MRTRLAIVLALWAFSATAWAAPPTAPHWVGSWTASEQIPEPANALAPGDLSDATLRQIVHLSLGGKTIRVRISNAFGTAPLHIVSVHVARAHAPAKSAIDPATDTALSFAGAPEVTIPAGADYLSDPVAFDAPALSSLAITLYLDTPPAQETGHPGSRATSYLVHGDQVSVPDMAGAKTVDHWYFVEGVDVAAQAGAAAIVALGDSITDGHASTTNGNDRWTDDLAARLAENPATPERAVLNEGIGGNRLLLDGLGPNALARFDRDVLAPPGVRWLIVLEGVNDIGMLTHDGPASFADHDAMVHRIIAAYGQIAARARAHGIKVYGATIMPFADSDFYHPDASTEADRQAINTWIRSTKDFDAVIDFDKAMRDPARPERLLPAYDSGDHLHPSPAGYRAVADAVPLALFGAIEASKRTSPHPRPKRRKRR